MLKDTKWDLPNPWYTGEFKDIRTFYAFVLSKPADETFYYPSPQVCGCGQYTKEYEEHHGHVMPPVAIELFNGHASIAFDRSMNMTGLVKWGTLAQVLSEFLSEEGYRAVVGEQSVEYIDA